MIIFKKAIFNRNANSAGKKILRAQAKSNLLSKKNHSCANFILSENIARGCCAVANAFGNGVNKRTCNRVVVFSKQFLFEIQTNHAKNFL